MRSWLTKRAPFTPQPASPTHAAASVCMPDQSRTLIAVPSSVHDTPSPQKSARTMRTQAWCSWSFAELTHGLKPMLTHLAIAPVFSHAKVMSVAADDTLPPAPAKPEVFAQRPATKTPRPGASPMPSPLVSRTLPQIGPETALTVLLAAAQLLASLTQMLSHELLQQ